MPCKRTKRLRQRGAFQSKKGKNCPIMHLLGVKSGPNFIQPLRKKKGYRRGQEVPPKEKKANEKKGGKG